MKIRTWIAGYFLAMLLCGINSYLTLKVGVIEEGVCITALLYAGTLILMRVKISSEELALVATMGSAGGAFGFIANFYAAFYLIGQPMTFWQMVIFSLLTSMLGLVTNIPLRQLYIVEESLPWPGSQAAIATMNILGGNEGKKQTIILFVFTALSFIYVFGSQILELAKMPALTYFGFLGLSASTIGLGIAWSPFIIGVGLWIGTRVGIGFLVAAILLTLFAPIIAQVDPGKPPHQFIWPGVMFMVTYGLTDLLMQWKTTIRAFQSVFSTRKSDRFNKKLDEVMSAKQFYILTAAVMLALTIFMYYSFNVPVHLTIIMAIFGAGIFNLIATRASAETAFNPIRIMSVMLQGVCAMFGGAPTAVNLSGAGFASGSIGQSSVLTSDNFFGRHFGVSAKQQWWLQLLVLIPITLVSVFVFMKISTIYVVGGDTLSSPIAKMWASMARMFGGELGSLPKMAIESMWIGGIAGILLSFGNAWVNKSLADAEGIKKLILGLTPHPFGIGIGLILPIYYSIAFFFGAILLCEIIPRLFKTDENTLYSVASAGLVGEGIASLIGAIMVASGLVKPILEFFTLHLPWMIK
ncbi:MAG: OPT family oligopeptide transporter [uncultured bacterium]|nr:MAG: OPT family oligopeptide transporter [uncultured bacterium]